MANHNPAYKYPANITVTVDLHSNLEYCYCRRYHHEHSVPLDLPV
jgi:hypothetical protein